MFSIGEKSKWLSELTTIMGKNSTASRAPIAAAVSFGSMLFGAGFLMISANQSADPTSALARQTPESLSRADLMAPTASKQPEREDKNSPSLPVHQDTASDAPAKVADTLPKKNSTPKTASIPDQQAEISVRELPRDKFSMTAMTSDGSAPSVAPKKRAALAKIQTVRGNAPRLNPRLNGSKRSAGGSPPEKTFSEPPTPEAAPREPDNLTLKPMATAASPLWEEESASPPASSQFQSATLITTIKRPPLASRLTKDTVAKPKIVKITLSKGENFVEALKRAGVRATDRINAAQAFGKLQDLRRLRPGQSFHLTVAEPNKTIFQLYSEEKTSNQHLKALEFRASPENRISLTRTLDGGFAAEKTAVEITTQLMTVQGNIEGSLYLSAKKQGAPDQTIANLANTFAYDVDFQREIFGGDEFEAIFEVNYDDEGALVSSGDILFARLKWRGKVKEKGYYRFAAENGGSRADFFDYHGQSAKRLLMKTPIDGARLSSGFGTRKHPILGYRKAHKGVDFAARRGTPIYAAGDGVVERANRYGSFGNYIKIRHSNNYKTAYAHLKGFKKGIRAGKRVEQGDIIGYVGTTGRSTGPHLHYEVHYKGKQVNPQKLKIETGVELKGKDLARFKKVRDQIDALRALPDPALELVAKDDTKSEL